MSMGIICLKSDNFNIYDEVNNIINEKKRKLMSLDDFNNLKLLMIRRRNSYAYVEFIRGKYVFTNICYLLNLLSSMTVDEREMIKTKDFEELWNNLWHMNNDRFLHRTQTVKNHMIEYNQSKNKFNILKNEGVKVNIGKKIFDNDGYDNDDYNYDITNHYDDNYKIEIYMNLEMILENTISEWTEPEWGFPKGRRDIREKNLTCAKREFREETNLKDTDYNLLPFEPFEECYLGTNHLRYKHLYYIAEVIGDPVITVNEESDIQVFEIGDIQWFSVKEAYQHLRNHNLERFQLIDNLFKLLQMTFVHPSIPPGLKIKKSERKISAPKIVDISKHKINKTSHVNNSVFAILGDTDSDNDETSSS